MNFYTILPGLKEVQMTSIEEIEQGMIIHIEMHRQPQCYPACGQMTLLPLKFL